jgi:hypothetical protein
LAFLGSALASAGPASAYVYWTNYNGGGTIGRANLDGTNVNQSFITGLSYPGAVAVDGSHIYWSNLYEIGQFQYGAIGRANLDGTNVNRTFIPDSGGGGLAVDGSYIYWSNFYETANEVEYGTIGRANLDGSDVNQSFITGLEPIGGVAVDGSHIYWAEDPRFGIHTIGRANLDGTNVNKSFISSPNYIGGGLAVDGSYIYWTGYASIGRANLDGTNINPSLITADTSAGGAPQPPADTSGVAVDSSHVYFAGPGAITESGYTGGHGTIGRANLDGTGVQSFITGTNGLGVAVDDGGNTCGKRSSPNVATALAALLCRYVQREAGITSHAVAILDAVGTLPKAVQSQIGTTTVWVLPSSGELDSAEEKTIDIETKLLKGYLDAATAGLKNKVAQKITEKILGGKIPCAVGAWKDLYDASASDTAAANDFASATQTLHGLAAGKLTALAATQAPGFDALAAKDLIDKLKSFSDALAKDAAGCFKTGDNLVGVLISELNTDSGKLKADQEAVEKAYNPLVPVSGFELVSPLPGNPNLLVIKDPTASILVPGLGPGATVTTVPPISTLNLPSASPSSAGSRTAHAARSLRPSGSGFAPGSRVEIFLSDTVKRALLTTNSTGSFTARLKVPRQTVPGRHELYAIGTAPDGGLRVLGARIKVRGHLPPHPHCVGILRHTTITGGLVVRPGIPCTLRHARVRGPVTIGRGAVFEADFSTIHGNVLARRPTAFMLCGGHVHGRVSVYKSAFPALIGRGNSPQCARTKIAGGRVTIRR